MILTDKMIELAKGNLPGVENEYNTNGPYSMFSSGSVEVEMAEYLYGFVRVVKPHRVLTTGAYHGISDLYMAQAMKDNKFGFITALEYEPQHAKRACELWEAAGVMDYIMLMMEDSRNYTPSGDFDMMFLDTEPNIRFSEFVRFVPFLQSGGYVVMHDLHRGLARETVVDGMKGWPFGEVPEEMNKMLSSGEIVKTNLPTPRGCTMFYKVHEGDYSAI